MKRIKKEKAMPDQKASVKETGEAKKPTAIAVQLTVDTPTGQPLLANYSNASVTAGLVILDFGFLEPAMLNALSRLAKSGGKVPQSVNGRLTARLALTPDSARNLHAQLSRMLSAPKPKDKTLN